MSDPRERGGESSPGLRAADLRAFLANIYDAHADALYRYAVMLLADPAAEDVLQEVFVKLSRMGSRTTRIESWEHYLRTAVRHECLRTVAARRREAARVDAAQQADLLEAAGPGPSTKTRRMRWRPCSGSSPWSSAKWST